MTAHTSRTLVLGALVSVLLATADTAYAAQEVHGSADAFAAPGVALAWGVLRGTDDARTMVIVRIVMDPAVYSGATVTGSDPFTGQRNVMTTVSKGTGVVDVRVPRAHFAAFPRTDLQFRAPGAAANTSLLVYYLGVPDTTPEFNDEGKLESYLRERVAQVALRKSP